MEEVSFLSQTLSLLFLLTISSFTYLLSKKIKFPYTVLLVLVWLIFVPLSSLNLFSFVDDFKLTPDVLFFVFLPVLLFEAAYNINYRQLVNSWKTISSLAIFWLLISSLIIWLGLFFIFPFIWLNIPFLVCLLFWTLISATDPVAVLSIFKSIWAPRRLTLIFEWESLFNDGTSVALFVVILWVILEWWIVNWNVIFSWLGSFLSMLFWWILFWIFTWVIFSKTIWWIKNNEEVEIVLTMVLAHVTFLLAELITHHFQFLPISWVISTVVAGIIIWNYWKYKITPRVQEHMHRFWDFFAFVSNSIVFILLGLILSDVDIDFTQFIIPIFIVIFIIMIARFVSIFIPIWIINALKLEENVSLKWQKLLSWWSLRWALALMLVLMIPWPWEVSNISWYWSVSYDDMLIAQTAIWWTYDFSIKDFLLVLTIWSIMFTLFVKATTISLFMKKMWIDKLHELEEFEYEEWKILSNLKILEKLHLSHKKAYLTHNEYEWLKAKYEEKVSTATASLKKMLWWDKQKADTLIRRAISLHALGIEKQYLKDMFLYNEIDERNFKYILRKIEKQMERVECENPQLSSISCRTNDYDIFGKIALKLHKDSSNPIDVYIRNRARVVITRKVIKELKVLKEVDFWFNKTVFEEVIFLYSSFNKNADKKKLAILFSHEKSIFSLESNLVNKSLLKLEEKVLKDMYSKEIITPKLYIKFMDELEEELFKDVRSAM